MHPVRAHGIFIELIGDMPIGSIIFYMLFFGLAAIALYLAVSGRFFFNDDIAGIREYFEPIMHKVILKTGDIDEEIFNGVYDALLEFYKFLAKRKVVSEYKSLENEMLQSKKELMEKMLRYKGVRHNDKYTKEEKEEKDEIREELFEGDAFWPFL